MIVIRNNLNIYQPKLSIESCIILEKLYGSITAPIEKQVPSLSEQVFLLSLCLRQYMLSEDEIYELVDDIDDLFSLILALYSEAGLINQDTEQNASEGQEMTNKDELEGNVPQTFEEMANDMLVQCLAIGLSRQEFYQSTLKEVVQCVEAYKTQQQNKLEEQAYFDWQLANLIGVSVARLLSKEAKYPKLEEAYPFINSTEDKPKDEHGMTAEEAQTNAMILEWCMLMQERQAKRKAKEEELNESMSSE